MNIYYSLGEYDFEWDEEKAKINKQKHGIRFETAVNVFMDKNFVDDIDELHSDFEERIKVIGKVKEILTVIYTERGENYRIISARRADKNEEALYYEQFYY